MLYIEICIYFMAFIDYRYHTSFTLIPCMDKPRIIFLPFLQLSNLLWNKFRQPAGHLNVTWLNFSSFMKCKLGLHNFRIITGTR